MPREITRRQRFTRSKEKFGVLTRRNELGECFAWHKIERCKTEGWLKDREVLLRLRVQGLEVIFPDVYTQARDKTRASGCFCS